MRYSKYNLMMDEIWVREKVKKKRFLLSFVQSRRKDGWEAIQTAGMGVGGRALVSACRVCDVYETPQWKRHTHHWVYEREEV